MYEFFRNEKLNANNFSNNSAGFGVAPMRWNQFGGAVGGPIKKDCVFFFADYQQTAEMPSALQQPLPGALMNGSASAAVV